VIEDPVYSAIVYNIEDLSEQGKKIIENIQKKIPDIKLISFDSLQNRLFDYNKRSKLRGYIYAYLNGE
jgi:uncharacterized protein with HEPN domain